jgi:hypothetical protein
MTDPTQIAKSLRLVGLTEVDEAAALIEQQDAKIAALESASKDAIRREALEADASRYQWLRDRYTGFDFDWMADDDGKNGKQVICFGMDEGMRIGRDVDAAIDDAIRALSQKAGE